MEKPTATKLAFLIDFDLSNPENSLKQLSVKFRELADIADRALAAIRLARRETKLPEVGRGWLYIN